MPKSPNIGFVRKEVSAKLKKWGLVDDCVEGEETIKAKGEMYLPKPDANTDLAKNEAQFKKYKLRAVFFPVTGRTLEGLIGQVFSKPIATDFAPSFERLENDVDGAGTNLEQQSKQALESVLKHGRAGLLSDFPTIEDGAIVTRDQIESGRIRPRVILYNAAQIINWREQVVGGETQLSLLVLKEEKDVSTDKFEIKCEPRWRVYELNEAGQVEVSVWKLVSKDKSGTNAQEYEVETEATTIRGGNGQPLTRIPFSFVGATNNDSSVDEAPLYPLACLNVAHYRNSADYEQSLFIAGQPTPVFTGLTDQWVKDHINGKVMLGSQNAVSLPPGSTAELLQAAPNSMPMEGMGHKEDQMKAIGAKLIEPGTVQRTATESEIEETSEASILSSVAKNVSAAYELAFYFCSLFGEEIAIDEITIALNSEFQVMGLNAQERQEVIAAWQGGVLTWEEVREVYRRKGIATEPDEDARTKIDNEQITLGGSQEDPDEEDPEEEGDPENDQ